ncbi:MAG: tRNA lysidine(34) synthetase TilS [Anaerolineae bacterium]|nr:tRNA lysidine(34) synthetase TilS [Anaerolineae bacterium]
MDTDPVLRNIRQLSAARGLFAPGALVVVGVSGGPDSLCLLHALSALREELGIRLHVATLDHMLRGAASAEDAAFVVETARAWGLPVTAERIDVPALEAALHLGIEETARQARYTFLARTALALGAGCIAVAHNADDQSETVLMHFLRGSGLAGLRGMLPVTPLSAYHLLPDAPDPAGLRLVRPLLTTPRAEVEDYCRRHGIATRFDRSNLDTTHFRNRLRHEVIPYLETVNPNLRALLRRTAEVAAADYDALRARYRAAWAQTCRREGESAIAFDRAAWRALPAERAARHPPRGGVPARPHAARREFHPRGGRRPRGARGRHRRRSDAARRAFPAGRLHHHHGPGPGARGRPAAVAAPLVGGADPGPAAGGLSPAGQRMALHADPRAPPLAPPLDDPWRAALMIPDGATVTLRARRPGDRFAPQGMAGHTQKLADFMINAKIPAPWRAHIPLLTVDGAIAWVAGWRVGHHFTVPPEAGAFYVARFTQ